MCTLAAVLHSTNDATQNRSELRSCISVGRAESSGSAATLAPRSRVPPPERDMSRGSDVVRGRTGRMWVRFAVRTATVLGDRHDRAEVR